ncbi:MAG: hypothetical protein AAGF58_13395 [Pseudomonadota bacterium]
MISKSVLALAAVALSLLFAGAGALWAQWGGAVYLAGVSPFCF